MTAYRKFIKCRAGFTLIEVLIAMVILMVGLLGIASMQIMAMRGNQQARESTERTVTANNFMEWLMSYGYSHDNLALGTHSITIDANGAISSRVSVSDDPPARLIPNPARSAGAIQTVGWVVLDYLDANGNGAKDTGEETPSKNITVTVQWEGGGQSSISNIKPNT